jgi:hypothetical protein
MTFLQPTTEVEGIDIYRLTVEITALRMVLSARASTRDQMMALGHIVAAEKAAERGDVSSAFGYLDTAGSWAWEIAAMVGFGVPLGARRTALAT